VTGKRLVSRLFVYINFNSICIYLDICDFQGIIPALEKVFPCAEHRFCLRHIHENMKQKFRGKVYKDALWKLATSTTTVYFDKAMDELKAVNRDAHEWLSKIPPKHWSRAHFSGNTMLS
jgi:transposase-like protein